jgi:hypothetical protein
MRAMTGSRRCAAKGESYSDVILRLADGRRPTRHCESGLKEQKIGLRKQVASLDPVYPARTDYTFSMR